MEQTISTSAIKVIVFRINEEEYGVDINQVKSIERYMPVTKLPNCADFVEGVVNLRGEVKTVIRLARLLGLKENEITDDTRMIVVSVGDTEAGLVVDAANEVMNIDKGQIEPPPEIIGGVKAEYLHGVAKLDDRLLILINLESVFHNLQL